MKKKYKLGLLGLVMGVINGFLGSGGGIVAVHYLEKNGFKQDEAHATSLFIMLPMCIISGGSYLLFGNAKFSNDVFMLIIGGAAGGILGALILGKLKVKCLDIVFTLFILVSGVRMLF